MSKLALTHSDVLASSGGGRLVPKFNGLLMRRSVQQGIVSQGCILKAGLGFGVIPLPLGRMRVQDFALVLGANEPDGREV